MPRYRPITTLLIAMMVALPLVSGASANEDVAAIETLLDGLHSDAAAARFDPYFARFTKTAYFLGTDKSERWDIDQFRAYTQPHFAAGRGWRYQPVARHIMGDSNTRWFDELLINEKYGHCRGTGVVVKTDDGWRIAHYSLTFLIPNDAAAEATALGKAAEAPSVP